MNKLGKHKTLGIVLLNTYIHFNIKFLHGSVPLKDFGPPSKSVRNSNTKLLPVQSYCNFLKEVRLGGWGTEGPKAPTLGRHVSVCATILRLRALLYLRASH